ncbi:hypothetical protein GIR22_03640 [Pseudomonas sp. CCM 7891]|uniref:Peptidase C58 YopT-type domain-containing protein n=1 Tax=Pseudomonas karstica TaxID=1055468 RepID=A0A7X2RQT8_9PSED|nr:hypothetical protein [Pseudomonas karstica]MTD18235.1 hypothetical protein [Pseudomonas karstica]
MSLIPSQPSRCVAAFHILPSNISAPDAEEVRSQASPPMVGVGPSLTPSNSAANLSPNKDLKTLLGDNENVRELAKHLRALVLPWSKETTPEQVLYALNHWSLLAHRDSTYGGEQLRSPTLAALIQSFGLEKPRTYDEVNALVQVLEQRASLHPLGDFGAGLSWSVPMSVDQQTEVFESFAKNPAGLPDLPIYNSHAGALGYLMNDLVFSAEESLNPVKALEKVLLSPKAQALGEAIQSKLGGIATPISVAEYVLTAIHLDLDRASINEPGRNKVAGFDLAHSDYWGKPPSAVVNGLRSHLEGDSSLSPEAATLATHILLTRVAPEYLVKNIPPSIVYGSQAWANLSMAVAKLEAGAPGAVANMTFAQVMKTADDSDAMAPESAQKAALVDWGVGSGVLAKKDDGSYTQDDIEKLRTTFNQQQDERIAASNLLNTEIPSRKAIALARLKERFGENIPFEEKLLEAKSPSQPHIEPLYNPSRRPVGLYSMLDIAMMELGNVRWKTSDNRIPVDAINAPLKLDVNKTFNDQFDQAVDSKKSGVHTNIKHLIAQLPLVDRQNLENGKLEFFQTKTYKLGLDFTSKTLHEKDNNLLVKSEGVNGQVIYEIDIKNGSIQRASPWVLTRKRERNANLEEVVTRFTPSSASEAVLSQKRPVSPAPPASFSSPRTDAIANAFVEHLEIDNQDVVKQAKGATPYSLQQDSEWKVADFFLNFIPLRSAIVNFSNGNYADGAFDLALDAFSFATVGAGAAAKIAKVAKSTVSGTTKALQVAKIIGVSTLTALNPADGIGDILVGAGRFVVSGAKQAVRGARVLGNAGTSLLEGIGKTRGRSGGYDLIKASTEHGVATTGTFKFAGQNVETTAVLHKGEWYAYDPGKGLPYGSPLKGITPQTLAVDGNVEAGWWDLVASLTGGTKKVPDKELSNKFQSALDNAINTNVNAYNRGFNSAVTSDVPGYSSSMDLTDLMELALDPKRTIEEIGCLANLIGKKRSQLGLENYLFYKSEIETIPGAVLRGMPQNFYLSQVGTLSGGECGALSNTMAFAVSRKKQDVLLDRLYLSAANPSDSGPAKLIENLRLSQDHFRKKVHSAEVIRQLPYQNIIDDLGNATSSKTLLISTNIHAVTAGVIIDNGVKKWFYYDPNFGLSTFSNREAMEKGLKISLGNERAPFIPGPLGDDVANPEYKVSVFNEHNLDSSNYNRIQQVIFSPL